MSGLGGAMAAATVIACEADVRAFSDEYSKLGKAPTKIGFSPIMPRRRPWRFRAHSFVERPRSEINLFAPLSLVFREIVTL